MRDGESGEKDGIRTLTGTDANASSDSRGLRSNETMRDALKALRKRDAKRPRDGAGLFRRAKG